MLMLTIKLFKVNKHVEMCQTHSSNGSAAFIRTKILQQELFEFGLAKLTCYHGLTHQCYGT